MPKIPKKKKPIPKALREQVWIQNVGAKFESKCLITWCQNTMNVFDFHVGHNIPESKGGKSNINNLKPICARCNLSMGNQYSITEWHNLGIHKKEVPAVSKISWWCC
jgi:5-methylcytosine-specific restriction endonuclease McrA